MPIDVDPALMRLGEKLVRRRIELSPAYRNRRTFTRDKGVEYKIVYDIESGRRFNFEPATLSSLEVAYELAPGALRRAAEKDSALEPVPVPKPVTGDATLPGTGARPGAPAIPGQDVTIAGPTAIPDGDPLAELASYQDPAPGAPGERDLLAVNVILRPHAKRLAAQIQHALHRNPAATGVDIFGESDLAGIWDLTTYKVETRLAVMALMLLDVRPDGTDTDRNDRAQALFRS